jgi:hypothetical protein
MWASLAEPFPQPFAPEPGRRAEPVGLQVDGENPIVLGSRGPVGGEDVGDAEFPLGVLEAVLDPLLEAGVVEGVVEGRAFGEQAPHSEGELAGGVPQGGEQVGAGMAAQLAAGNERRVDGRVGVGPVEGAEGGEQRFQRFGGDRVVQQGAGGERRVVAAPPGEILAVFGCGPVPADGLGDDFAGERGERPGGTFGQGLTPGAGPVADQVEQLVVAKAPEQ